MSSTNNIRVDPYRSGHLFVAKMTLVDSSFSWKRFLLGSVLAVLLLAMLVSQLHLVLGRSDPSTTWSDMFSPSVILGVKTCSVCAGHQLECVHARHTIAVATAEQATAEQCSSEFDRGGADLRFGPQAALPESTTNIGCKSTSTSSSTAGGSTTTTSRNSIVNSSTTSSISPTSSASGGNSALTNLAKLDTLVELAGEASLPPRWREWKSAEILKKCDRSLLSPMSIAFHIARNGAGRESLHSLAAFTQLERDALQGISASYVQAVAPTGLTDRYPTCIGMLGAFFCRLRNELLGTGDVQSALQVARHMSNFVWSYYAYWPEEWAPGGVMKASFEKVQSILLRLGTFIFMLKIITPSQPIMA